MKLLYVVSGACCCLSAVYWYGAHEAGWMVFSLVGTAVNAAAAHREWTRC